MLRGNFLFITFVPGINVDKALLVLSVMDRKQM